MSMRYASSSLYDEHKALQYLDPMASFICVFVRTTYRCIACDVVDDHMIECNYIKTLEHLLDSDIFSFPTRLLRRASLDLGL